MGILITIDRAINMIPEELIENSIIFAEVDRDSYKEVDEEFSKIVNDVNFIQEQKVPDIGKGKIFQRGNLKIIITENKNIGKSNSFYIAFKTKEI